VSEPEHVNLVWHKSSASLGQGDCVEVAFGQESVYLRHSQRIREPVVQFEYQEWAAFLVGVRNGEFDPPAPPVTSESDYRLAAPAASRSGTPWLSTLCRRDAGEVPLIDLAVGALCITHCEPPAPSQCAR
jgi:hypothetical protein